MQKHLSKNYPIEWRKKIISINVLLFKEKQKKLESIKTA
jgi:hypothetical protein